MKDITIEGYRRTKPFQFAERLLGGSWFFLLALSVLERYFREAGALETHALGYLVLLSRFELVVFYALLFSMIVFRPIPIAETRGILSRIAAFIGTYLPWGLVFFGDGEITKTQSIASAILILAGTSLTILVLLNLGYSFSIVPQARALVRTGPYAIVRHPLYLAEEIAIIGAVVEFYSPAALMLLAVHIGLQLLRISYEEDLLSRAFPDYASYAGRTPRLIPYFW